MAADPPGRTDVADPSKPQLQHAVVVGEVPHVGCDVCDLQAKHDDYVREATETIDLLERERDEALVRADIAEGGTGTI